MEMCGLFQVYLRIRDEEWNTYKRYKEFDDLHQKMKKSLPLSARFEFPPKKSFGKKVRQVYHCQQGLNSHQRNHLVKR